jgi:hypothetical protein
VLYPSAKRGVRAIGIDRFVRPNQGRDRDGRITRQTISDGHDFVPLVVLTANYQSLKCCWSYCCIAWIALG